MTEDRRYHVAIIGAGVVGTAIARQLARYRLRTVLLEHVQRRRHRAPRRPTPPSCTPASTPSRGASSPSWSDGATSCCSAYADSGGDRARADRGRAGGLGRGAGGPARRRAGQGRANGYDACGAPRARRAVPARAASREGARGPSPSPTSRSSARGARASPSPPKRSAPASSSGSASRSPTSARRRRLAARTPLGDPSGPPGWSTPPVSASTSSTGASATMSSRSRLGGASSSSSTSWPVALVSAIVLPVPTERTKGVLVAPTVYGNVLLGPTAEDIDDREDTATTAVGLDALLDAGRRIVPELVDEEVTATYAGLRAATEHRDYQITIHEGERYACVGGIRSTGLDRVARHRRARRGPDGGGRAHAGGGGTEPTDPRHARAGARATRAFEDARRVEVDPAYGHIVCFCERVTEGEAARRAPFAAARQGSRRCAPPHPGDQRALSGLLLRRRHRGPAGGAVKE